MKDYTEVDPMQMDNYQMPSMNNERKFDLFGFTRELKTMSMKEHLSEKQFENFLKQYPSSMFDNHIYNVIMGFYIRKNNYSMVEKVFQQIKKPDQYNYTELIKSYAYEGNVEKAEQLFKSIKTPDSKVYNSMLLLYSKQRNIEKVEEILQQLSKKNIKPNRFTYSILIDAYSKVGHLEKAESTFQEACEYAKSTNSFDFLDIQLVNTLLSSFFNSGQHEKATTCFNNYVLGEPIDNFDKKVSKKTGPLGIVPNQRTIVIMLSVFEAMKDEKKFENLIRVMKTFHIRPNAYIDTKLIQHFFDEKKYSSVIDVYTNNLQRNDNYNPLLMRHIVQSFAALNDTDNVILYTENAEQKGRINAFNLHNFIYALALVKKAEMAEKLFKNYKNQLTGNPKQVIAYNSMLLCYVRCGQSEKAITFYKNFPVQPDNTTERILRERFDRKKKE